MIQHCQSFLLERSAEWGVPTTGRWDFLFNNNYHPHYSGLNLLWFYDREGFPRVVTKVCRDGELLKREFANLQHAYGCAPAWVPRPLHIGLHDGFWMLWMQGVPGLRFQVRNDRSGAALRSVVEMVGAFHRAVRKGPGGVDLGRYRQMVLEPLRTVAQFGPSLCVSDGCSAIAARTPVEWFTALPIIPQHGDLFVSNLVSHRGQWSIVDWESFGMIDLPFYDVFTLLVSVARAGGETPEQWDPDLLTRLPVLVDYYARLFGLSPADIGLLLPLTLANWFHLQWSDNRKAFTELMYKMLQHYFEHVDIWERAFVPAARSLGSA